MNATLALGTYRCRNVAHSAEMAASAGATWIDTAANYAAGMAEPQLAAVLATRPNIGVSTKVGFIPRPDRQAALARGLVTVQEAAAGHSLTPAYLRWQIERSAQRLGRGPDVVFVHNPEHHHTGSPLDLARRLLAAFTTLEAAVAAGQIGGYGVATWSGFATGLLDVPGLLDLAISAGRSRHHLRAIQLPLSLIHLEPIAQALHGQGVLAQAAAGGLEVYASAPLDGGTIPSLVTPELAALIASEATLAQAALSVVASAPGVNRVLLSTSDQEHWLQAEAAVNRPPLPPDHLRKIIDVLGT